MKLEIVETLGGDYHIVEISDAPGTPDPWYREAFKDVDEWCEQTFGQQDIWGRDIVSGWKRMSNKYYFVGEDKLNWFVLRWS